MQALPPALAPLAAYRQFIAYRLAPRNDGSGKTDKLPADPRTGRTVDAHDPAAWADADTAIAAATVLGDSYGVGFVFTADDPFFFLDVDNCLRADGWSALARDMMSRLAGAAVEISGSRTGLHVIGTAAAPAHKCRDAAGALELYTSGRFVALTGDGALGDASTDCTAALAGIIAEYFPPDSDSAGETLAEWTTAPRPDWSGPDDDDELIRRACASTGAANVFGTRASFDALWRGDPDVLGRAYPDDYGNRDYDGSKADAALAAHLAFWAGGNCERIADLMRQSALARPKWDQHRTYLARTITGAVGRCTDVYRAGGGQQQQQPVGATMQLAPQNTSDTSVTLADSYQYLSAQQQIDYFAGCVYVQDMHRVYTPRGALLKPEQFRATYSGYVFALDATNDKTTKNAWEAFVESQVVRYPIAEGVTFRPELPPGALTEEENTLFVNTYAPPGVHAVEGDVTKFLDHLHRMLPDERDAGILLAYMAACVQHQGTKFQWTPIIQGVEGNGKTMLSYAVAYACGYKYSHFPKASEVGSKHNTWLMRRTFVGIEDVYYPEHRQEIIEDLKPLITNTMLAVEPKQVDQFSTRVCANFILNSNHRAALRKTRNDRRFAPFFTAQQRFEDLARDGMDGDYFPDLYAWLRGDGPYEGQPSGYAQVAHYLRHYPIPDEYDPAGSMHRAPDTSTTDEAIAESTGRVEQEILEAISEGRTGFAGGWVSSMALDRLLESLRMARAIGHRRRREILQELGYEWHPALPDGRAHNPISIDNGRPRLFIHHDHPDRSIESPTEAVAAYVAAQQPGPGPADRAFGGDS